MSNTTMNSSNSLNNISTLMRSPIHNHFHGHLTIRRLSNNQFQQRHQHPA